MRCHLKPNEGLAGLLIKTSGVPISLIAKYQLLEKDFVMIPCMVFERAACYSAYSLIVQLLEGSKGFMSRIFSGSLNFI